jgi:F0F1-type ATP synthase beta subunit
VQVQVLSSVFYGMREGYLSVADIYKPLRDPIKSVAAYALCYSQMTSRPGECGGV